MLITFLCVLGVLLLANLLLLVFSSNDSKETKFKSKPKTNGPKNLKRSKKTKYVLYADK